MQESSKMGFKCSPGNGMAPIIKTGRVDDKNIYSCALKICNLPQAECKSKHIFGPLNV